MTAFAHDTVLLNETVDFLQVKPNGVYVDCTLGGGGHAEQILSRLGPDGKLYAFDQDETAAAAAKKRLSAYGSQLEVIETNFAEAAEELQSRGVNKVDGVIFDLGVSSPQLDEPDRGFSYWYDAPLDMRMNQNQSLTAEEIINEWRYEDLLFIISKYGEEKFAKPVARAIEREREKARIQTTTAFAEIVKEAIPAAARRTGGHPAKRTFQAVRIAVNNELGVFEEALKSMIDMLRPGGVISVISFHSLEDRLAKRIFKQESTPPELPRGMPVVPEGYEPNLKLLTRKPVLPSEAEQSENHRARSAKLRAAQKVKGE
ncbi:16S rRNA (cytosine1402-N4)-methyltransferase [Salsuginibacillus halophilus]|uniref:Ribosomal RNA small subunit methyltransferase H n=1 Tax=Salsuginibacillus halophilus TaxID=517424 RepID=A0A2P8HX50_9BACI|nr:16S rRNA (cytosine(1402)-N(4))-methyltransferase RsmH [Salsuginibacillus halophilus]PSL50778.1 16S rRNA (cytosine1402-N4)-methyltransferase [Salsuginibacillus halophilus]